MAPGNTLSSADLPSGEGRIARSIRIDGIVQGVGFRPFVHALANRLGLAGSVGNDPRGVRVVIEGDATAVEHFLDDLVGAPPPLAMIERVVTLPIAATGRQEFRVLASRSAGHRRAMVPADVATCADCLREVFDPVNRRYRYPFTNCTACGPRFTIVTGVPYDRERTTMARFTMCTECAREYTDPTDRRFHAEPICCAACGPTLRLLDRAAAQHACQVIAAATRENAAIAAGEPTWSEGITARTAQPNDASATAEPDEPIARAAQCLRNGAIVAVKGIGGYHLAALASDETAVSRLRARKHREDRPFAVMVADVAAARALAHVDPIEERLLAGTRRPIVLLRRRDDAPRHPLRARAPLAAGVAPANRRLGVMLPYTPLHHLLCREVNAPIVLTSGNVSDEPIACDDGDAFRKLSSIADFFLVHDRPIHVRTDDSVVRVVRGRETLVRRARGYAPQALVLARAVRRPILACGAELKNTFCLARGRRAFLSHHIGDLENWQTLRAFTDGIAHFRRLFAVEPEIVAHDLHPEYLSSKYAFDLDGVERIAVQHHHAHIASCLADNGEEGPVIGVAFDGLGFGTDATYWGGEVLVADTADFERVGHFAPVPLPGGAAAIREPWRMALSYLQAIGDESLIADLAVTRRNAARWPLVARIARAGIASPPTSSAGRLFDAVAAILGIRDTIRYEGQAAVELEQRADAAESGAYRARLEGSHPFRIRGADLVRAVADDVRAGVAVARVAARFHNGMANAIVEACVAVRESRGLSAVALSGGVFQNELLLERAVAGLESRGFRVLTHCRVPANDAGISLGQTVVAAARDRSLGARRGLEGRA